MGGLVSIRDELLERSPGGSCHNIVITWISLLMIMYQCMVRCSYYNDGILRK